MNKLNKKLELLHLCLVKENIPEKITNGLEEYEKDFEEFKKITKKYKSSNEEQYAQALKVFRDILLSN